MQAEALRILRGPVIRLDDGICWGVHPWSARSVVVFRVQVKPRCLDRGMPQVSLDKADVGAGIGLMRGRRVTQPVRGGTSQGCRADGVGRSERVGSAQEDFLRNPVDCGRRQMPPGVTSDAHHGRGDLIMRAHAPGRAPSCPAARVLQGQIPSIDIARRLWFVASRTGFLKAFAHVLDRYVRHETDPRELLACIIAMCTNMGLRKMAEISGPGYASLASCARNYLRVETVHSANDAISNATAELPAFHLFNIGDQIHSSSDGQRFETQFDTFQAR